MSGAAAAAPEPLVLVVPNFSEGRRAEVMDAIVAAMTSVPGLTLLNRQSDPDHNRLDTTLIGSPEAARAAAMAGAAKAVELIDMEQHHGSHPRMGAVDVIPFIPIRGVTMDDCVELARDCARELAETLSLPVYLYEGAASTPERASLADVRRGEYEGLRADVAEGRRLPDMGPHQLGKAGATARRLQRVPGRQRRARRQGGGQAGAGAVRWPGSRPRHRLPGSGARLRPGFDEPARPAGPTPVPGPRTGPAGGRPFRHAGARHRDRRPHPPGGTGGVRRPLPAAPWFQA